MKRNSGLVAGFLAVLTIVGISNLPNKSSESAAATEPKNPPVPSAGAVPAPKSPRPYGPCTEIAKRLRRLIKDADKPVDSWELPRACYESDRPNGLEKVQASSGVRFAVAMVPNPVTTHLPLLFDRLAQTIQQAARDENYSYDASWFPWDAPNKTYPLLGDQQAAENLLEIQQGQPGVVVFRRAPTSDPAKASHDKPYEGGLAVLLVGEQPTGGISDGQLKNALAWIAHLGGLAAGGRRVLGPTFSGSFPSLRRALEHSPKIYSKLFVSSGTASSADDYQWFKQWITSL